MWGTLCTWIIHVGIYFWFVYRDGCTMYEAMNFDDDRKNSSFNYPDSVKIKDSETWFDRSRSWIIELVESTLLKVLIGNNVLSLWINVRIIYVLSCVCTWALVLSIIDFIHTIFHIFGNLWTSRFGDLRLNLIADLNVLNQYFTSFNIV